MNSTYLLGDTESDCCEVFLPLQKCGLFRCIGENYLIINVVQMEKVSMLVFQTNPGQSLLALPLSPASAQDPVSAQPGAVGSCSSNAARVMVSSPILC